MNWNLGPSQLMRRIKPRQKIRCYKTDSLHGFVLHKDLITWTRGARVDGVSVLLLCQSIWLTAYPVYMSKDCLCIRNENRIKANENEVFCLLVLGWAFYFACGSIKKPNKEPIMKRWYHLWNKWVGLVTSSNPCEYKKNYHSVNNTPWHEKKNVKRQKENQWDGIPFILSMLWSREQSDTYSWAY